MDPAIESVVTEGFEPGTLTSELSDESHCSAVLAEEGPS